jgi:hypothetical protein
MPWINEQRQRRSKVVEHDTDAGRQRIAVSTAVMHYESVLDSGNFDTEVDLRPQRVNNAQLNGWIVNTNGWRFAYQGFAPVQQQPVIGTLGYGGRGGEHWFTMRPARIGFLRWNTRTFQDVGGAPNFGVPTLQNELATFGIDDADPWRPSINASFVTTISDIWTPGAGSVDWIIKGAGGRLKQDFVINQAARDAIVAAFNNGPANQNWFGVAYRVSWLDIPRIELNGVPISPDDDVEPTNNLAIRNAAGRLLGQFQNGEIYVRGRGGNVPIRKRFYFDGTDWWLFIGARVDLMNQNLLDGDLVIDPPISEEIVGADGDDAWQGTGAQATMSLGYSGNIYNGSEANRNYHMGFRFRTVPIGNGDTVNSATLEPMQNSATGSTAQAGTLYGEDADDAAIFTTTNNDITDRARTATSVNLTDTDFPGNGSRASWDVSGALQNIVDRGGWASNNSLAFLWIDTTPSYSGYTAWDDYSGTAANACQFNADVTAAGGGSAPNLLTLLGVG